MKNKKFFSSCFSSKKGAENISKQRQNMGSKKTAAMVVLHKSCAK